jgi:hypothetical protein
MEFREAYAQATGLGRPMLDDALEASRPGRRMASDQPPRGMLAPTTAPT